jgi:hypothetical protein
MANVLPPSFKKTTWRIQRARFVIVLSIVLGVLVVIALIALAPSYLALEFAAPQTIDVPEVERRDPADAIAISRAHSLVTQLSSVISATSSPTELFARVLAVRPAGISVDSISYSETDSRISLSGTGTREAISAYRDILSEDQFFSSVSVPVGALVGASNGRFSITITIQRI